MTDSVTSANGIRVHYRRTGGAHPPVVLLHGLTGDSACWAPVARVLAPRFDVVMPDARGHGRSSAPHDGYRYEELANDVVALIHALELSRPVLVGHSMGGMTAALIATRDADLPRGLVLVDPTFLDLERQREVHASDVVGQHRRVLELTRAELVAELRAHHPHRSNEIVECLADARLRTSVDAFAILEPPHPPYRELVSAIKLLTLLVIGDRPVVSFETATELCALNPRMRVQQIAQAGHGLPFDQPSQIAALIAALAS